MSAMVLFFIIKFGYNFIVFILHRDCQQGFLIYRFAGVCIFNVAIKQEVVQQVVLALLRCVEIPEIIQHRNLVCSRGYLQESAIFKTLNQRNQPAGRCFGVTHVFSFISSCLAHIIILMECIIKSIIEDPLNVNFSGTIHVRTAELIIKIE